MDLPSPSQPGTESTTMKAMAVADFSEQLKFGVVFEGYILSRYGTYDQSTSAATSVVRADLVDEEGFATITLQVFKDLIPGFEKLIKKRSWVRVENFQIQLKKISYDKGDAPVVIVLNKDSVKEKKWYLRWSSETEEHKSRVNKKTIFHIDFADGVTTDDKETVVFMSGCEDDRNYILSEFRKKRYAMFILKNLFSGVYDNKRSLQFRTSTIIAPVYDEDCVKHLQNVVDF
ncbi:hypothetical protein GOP47_0004048 [Adiantum capillus-veneris]|uniref:Uncharacterized protein n=1 Tax=Adiantum capillus-veneris TaxID=13818 RepID=A0A9D4V6S4_ADICA|nr:hypothetical protein GOP47_0004048 [Adiantum capillus-veneris]